MKGKKKNKAKHEKSSYMSLIFSFHLNNYNDREFVLFSKRDMY